MIQIFRNKKPPYCNIQTDLGELDRNDVFVISSEMEDEKGDSSLPSVATLLATPDLRKEFEAIQKEVDAYKDDLFKSLATLSGKRDAETLVIDDFKEYDNIYNLVRGLETVIKNTELNYLENIKYGHVITTDVKNFVSDQTNSRNLKQYVSEYKSMIEKSKYYKAGFDHYFASQVGTALDKNNFFAASHYIRLKPKDDSEDENICSKKALLELIENEKKEINDNDKIKEAWDKIDKSLEKAVFNDFKKTINKNPEVIDELYDYDTLKQKLWIQYFTKEVDKFNALIEVLNRTEKDRERIIKAVEDKKTEWSEVIKTFNIRFKVPYEPYIDNKRNVCLQGITPTIGYKFCGKPMDRSKMYNMICRGEKRALLLLDFIYQVKEREIDRPNTLFIIDDIADSFDYKNKYAIIEYLNDMIKEKDFKLLIMTHNYDFFRTIVSRLDLAYENDLIAEKSPDKVDISPIQYHNDPFNYWVNNISKPEFLIALIPFARNIASYISKQDEKRTLDKLLHYLEETQSITFKELSNVYKEVIGKEIPNADDTLVINKIFEVADRIEQINPDDTKLENKIILSIAIRLVAERYMLKYLSGKPSVEIKDDLGTRDLFDLCVKEKLESERTQTLESVLLMTPENIHLNSFMYEPILDMGIHHLVTLYKEVIRLSESNI